jgi:hypothetical protein
MNKIILLLIHITASIFAQTYPEQHNLSYSDFSFNGFSSSSITIYPSSMQGWVFSSEPTSAITTNPSSNRTMVHGGSAFTTGSIRNEVDKGISFLSSNTSNIGAICVSLNTLGTQQVLVEWTCTELGNPNPNGDRSSAVVLQYKIGDDGTWSTIENTLYVTHLSQSLGLTPAQNFSIILPVEVNNQEVVYLRWLYYMNGGAGSRDRIALNNILIQPQSLHCEAISTWNGTTWVGGLPNQGRIAVIDSPYNTDIGGSFTCCNLINNSDIIITSGEHIAVVNHIQNNQSLLVETGGQLIPLNDFTTSDGVITIQRRTTPMKRYDYTYISSPVTSTIGQMVGTWQNNRTYQFVTENFIDIETVFQNGQPSIPEPDGQDDDGDAWLLAPQGLVTTAGKGYAAMIRSVPNTPPYPRTELISFTGELNTGVISYPLKFSGNPLVDDDDFNLVGNPYSAAINANNLIDENINRINGTLSFWTHTGTLSPNYSGLQSLNFSNQDYAYYTKLGGTSSSFGGRTPNNIIGTGQGFIVEAELEEDLIFKPLMMSIGYVNSTSNTFFRNSLQTSDVRVWLNLHTTDNELFSQQLIGYNGETTKEFNKGWDHLIRDARMALKFYSFDNNNQKNDIQSRGEFNILDQVDLGYFSAIEGDLTISLDNIEGLEGVYIKDGENICELPYTFNTEIGEFNNRFKLIYTNVLSINDFNNEVYIIPNPTHGLLQIINLGDRRVNIYDSLGREVNFHIYDNIVDISYLSIGIYFLVITDNNEEIKIKVIKK